MNEINKSTAVRVEVESGEWVGGLPALWHEGARGTSFQNRQKAKEMGYVTYMDPSGSCIPDKIPKEVSLKIERNEDPVWDPQGL